MDSETINIKIFLEEEVRRVSVARQLLARPKKLLLQLISVFPCLKNSTCEDFKYELQHGETAALAKPTLCFGIPELRQALRLVDAEAAAGGGGAGGKKPLRVHLIALSPAEKQELAAKAEAKKAAKASKKKKKQDKSKSKEVKVPAPSALPVQAAVTAAKEMMQEEPKAMPAIKMNPPENGEVPTSLASVPDVQEKNGSNTALGHAADAYTSALTQLESAKAHLSLVKERNAASVAAARENLKVVSATASAQLQAAREAVELAKQVVTHSKLSLKASGGKPGQVARKPREASSATVPADVDVCDEENLQRTPSTAAPAIALDCDDAPTQSKGTAGQLQQPGPREPRGPRGPRGRGRRPFVPEPARDNIVQVPAAELADLAEGDVIILQPRLSVPVGNLRVAPGEDNVSALGRWGPHVRLHVVGTKQDQHQQLLLQLAAGRDAERFLAVSETGPAVVNNRDDAWLKMVLTNAGMSSTGPAAVQVAPVDLASPACLVVNAQGQVETSTLPSELPRNATADVDDEERCSEFLVYKVTDGDSGHRRRGQHRHGHRHVHRHPYGPSWRDQPQSRRLTTAVSAPEKAEKAQSKPQQEQPKKVKKAATAANPEVRRAHQEAKIKRLEERILQLKERMQQEQDGANTAVAAGVTHASGGVQSQSSAVLMTKVNEAALARLARTPPTVVSVGPRKQLPGQRAAAAVNTPIAAQGELALPEATDDSENEEWIYLQPADVDEAEPEEEDDGEGDNMMQAVTDACLALLTPGNRVAFKSFETGKLLSHTDEGALVADKLSLDTAAVFVVETVPGLDDVIRLRLADSEAGRGYLRIIPFGAGADVNGRGGQFTHWRPQAGADAGFVALASVKFGNWFLHVYPDATVAHKKRELLSGASFLVIQA